MLVSRSTSLCFRMLRCLMLVWVGLVMPSLVQAERICDGFAHDLNHMQSHVTGSFDPVSDEEHPSSQFDHSKSGHCHSPLGHDQVDTPRHGSAALPSFTSIPAQGFSAAFLSHIPTFPDRPPRA